MSSYFWKLSSVLEPDIEVRWFLVMGVWISLEIEITISSDVNCCIIVGISFLRHDVILVTSDDFSKLPRALLVMSSKKSRDLQCQKYNALECNWCSLFENFLWYVKLNNQSTQLKIQDKSLKNKKSTKNQEKYVQIITQL